MWERRKFSKKLYFEIIQEFGKDGHFKVFKENIVMLQTLVMFQLTPLSIKMIFDYFFNFAYLISIFQKSFKRPKDNYRSRSILKNVTKIHQKIMFKQSGKFLENFSSQFQCRSQGRTSSVQSQPAFICPKLIIETPEQGVKYVQS